MYEYSVNQNGKITKDGHTMFYSDILMDLKRMAYLETLHTKNKDLTKCALVEIDFELNFVKFEIPKTIIDKGFHAGSAFINFSGVQD